ncbi:nuclear intron maturase 3, mitochondrial [Mercurialis annua]|uniref:nuclear intron maturase 3, mitochondrial n=1 Tax=Mercurialis annua TaxID=3986 RepID=UPI00215EC5EB|nr:nuclear intron maturase 3, mitochondrial [Mercurialis annua]XP_055961346.1 nuclear intron maturase 3, mitochondrial [Mercurialis annua]XP_055961347.1 nuclear intron maturase 3, mitochondrial [Mercurialis annua]XP_055961348.1 nuclear intron maturase 3, mitochondrial [Mercurialis annua]XP_055961349.1 nuclear intron maturase 3, mitochondrial [Mercurialis annua]XP_055961350.1 nuclear intron maturase 3, mitochondrial [Mercurialis annua]XP_055961351.1 nuclear intron maturase 3, mitochondrial [Me
MLIPLNKITPFNLKLLSSHFKLFHSTTLPSLNPNPSVNPFTKQQLKSIVLSQYTHGRFTDLIQNVVALPSVLLSAAGNLISGHNAANQSLYSSVSNHFSIEEMGTEIFEKRLEIESNCVKFESKGEFLIMPNLKLKVFIEAIRAVLEIVYDDRFVTFCYGGRVDMGRHTAIRYLKNSVENPSWWFSVCFKRIEFDSRNVDKLCLFMGEKINDKLLIDVIKRLFECGVLKIELGGSYLGKGLPQECGLSAILINIYFNGFDKEIQELRLRISEKNPKFEGNEIRENSNSFFKMEKVYAVRYLDEILVATSGSKVLVMDLKSKVLKFLEEKLELKVDTIETAIHSATSEKIDFLGMELQAVPPSVLHPPMSEKAIRARKKYIRQKEVKSLELRNARERNRKRLGSKILSHIFKKLKKSNGFKSEFQIENEVREIFATWSDEVVQEFLGSLDERWQWHRMLTAGDFLTLRHIRDQLPEDLVDAYDKFQEQVNKHLSPVKVKKELEEEEMRIRKEEERKYAKRTVEDLTKLCMKVSAPVELLKKAVKMAEFTNHMGRPRPISFLTKLEDADIIKWYGGVGRRWLDFFCCTHNLKTVKTIVSYHLRFSCILTLAEKHEATKREVIKHYTKDLKVTDMDGNKETYFPTEKEVKMMGDKNLSDPKPVDGALSLALIRLAIDEPSHSCVAHFCDRRDALLYRVRLVKYLLNANPTNGENWIPGMAEVHECIDRICLPLCCDHISDVYTGKITLQDIDCTSFVHVD